MVNSSLALVAPATANRTVRRPNAELRTRELTAGEIERLIEAASTNRQGQRNALMTLLTPDVGWSRREAWDQGSRAYAEAYLQ